MGTIGRMVAVGMLGATLGLGGAVGCSTIQKRQAATWSMQPNPKLVAAKGQVLVGDAGEAGNRQIWVQVEHLAPSERAFGKAHYVVWVVPREGGEPQNMGVLMPGDNLKASHSFKTAFRNFDVLVTAEDQTNATSPSEDRAFQASVTAPA